MTQPTKKIQDIQKKNKKGEKQKVTKKNILMSPFHNDWPHIKEETENYILDTLVEKLSEFPRLAPEKERGGVASKKRCEGDEDLIRKKMRLQLALGHRQVCKGLERDELGLLLVWAGQPPILLQSLYQLAVSRGCPALRLQSLMPKVSEAFGLSSLLAVGFRKCQPELNDFEGFICKAASMATPLTLPWLNPRHAAYEYEEDTSPTGDETEVEKGGKEGPATLQSPQKVHKASLVKEKIDWPAMTEDLKKDVLAKLCCLLKSYSSVFKPQTSKRQLKDKRNVVRNNLVTDIHVMSDIAKSGRLILLLVQHEVDLPSAALTSAVETAVRWGCPVLHLDNLRKTLAPLLRNPFLKAVGFKTPKGSKMETPAEFTDFVAFVKQFAPSVLTVLLPDELPNSKSKVDEKTQNSKQIADHGEKGPKSEAKTFIKKTPIPLYDVSHLYMYKSDSDAAAQIGGSEKKHFKLSWKTETFISLSSEPSVRFIMPKTMVCQQTVTKTSHQTVEKAGIISSGRTESTRNGHETEAGETTMEEKVKSKTSGADDETKSEQEHESSISVYSKQKRPISIATEEIGAFVDTSPAKNKSKHIRSENIKVDKKGKESASKDTKGSYAESQCSEGCDSLSSFGVMGLDSAGDGQSEQTPFFHEALRPKMRAKLKRKLEAKADGDDFVSFKLVPSKIQTSIANPNKKKKKKGKERK